MRKIMMVGFAMLTGLPQAVLANGSGKQETTQAYSGWNSPYSPHYGIEGAKHPLLEHLSAPVARNTPHNSWQLEPVPPRMVVTDSDNPLMDRARRVGFSLKLQF